MSNNSWINMIKKHKKDITKLIPKEDRLEYVSAIAKCMSSIGSSVKGWYQWLANPMVMDNFTEEQLKALYNEVRTFALDFLELDLKYTKLLYPKEGEEKKRFPGFI